MRTARGPRSIIMNRKGRRFPNEAVSYNAVGGAFHQEGDDGV